MHKQAKTGLRVLLDLAHDGLVDLHNRDDQECQAKSGQQRVDGQRHEAEDLGQEVDLDGNDGQHQREGGGAPQPLVLEARRLRMLKEWKISTMDRVMKAMVTPSASALPAIISAMWM